MGYLAPGYVP
jgi:hypothetical protein